MRGMRLVAAVGVGGLATAALVLVPMAVSADVVSPAGVCTASGQWESAGFTKNSVDYTPSDVIKVPQKDHVDWIGQEDGKPIGYIGPKRPIDGAVQLTLPFGIKVTVWHWKGNASARYSNKGQEKYNVPSVLIGIPIQLSGYESDSGKTVCSGSVYVEVTGSTIKNPIGWGGIAGTVLFGAGLLASGLRKTRAAYDDINP